MFAAIREKLLSRNRPKKPSRCRRLSIEALEERALMTASPLVFGTLQEGLYDVGNTISTARTAAIAPMMETQIQGKLSSGADVDIFRVSLRQGQIITANANTSATFGTATRFGTTAWFAKVSLLNSAGSPVTTNTTLSGQSLEYRVPQSGTYYVKVTDSAPTSSDAVSYSVDLRPVGLNNAIDANYLGKTGAMSAFLDGTNYSDGTKVLDIAGPVGHGFGIRGNWTETVSYTNGLPGATYQANGTVYLQTPNGEVPIPLPPGGIALTTKPQQWGSDFGEVGSIDWNAPANLATYEAILAAVYPMGLFDLAAIKEGTKIGIGLGSETVVQNTGAPVNPAVPYLYLTANPLMNSSIGSGTQLFSVVADPADPFLYIGSPMTSGVFPITGLAASQQGLIPFTPVTAPSQFSGTLRGHVYVSGTIDTTSLTMVPSEVDGDLVLNVDPNHSGKLFGGAAFTTNDLVTALTINPLAVLATNPDAVHSLFTNMSVGINGELNVSPFAKFSDAVPDAVNRFGQRSSLVQFLLDQEVPKVLTVGQASLIYDGPTESAYFRGGTNNPFDGTPLASLSPTSVDIDGAIKPGGAFYLDVKGGYKPFGLNATGGVEIKNNWPTEIKSPIGFGTLKPTTVYVTSITADATVTALGVNAELHGSVQGNGDFVLNGSVDTVSFGGLGGSASFVMSNSQRNGFSFTSHLDATFLVTAVVRANIDVDFTFGVNTNGQVTYSGYGSASVDVWAPKDGWQVWDWHWENIGSVGVGVSNSKIWFTANGTTYSIDLPH